MLWGNGSVGSLVRRIFKILWKNIKHIPDNELLWRSVYNPTYQIKADGTLKPGFFVDKNGLSCDLARFSTIETSLRGYSSSPHPEESGLVELAVYMLRNEQIKSDVIHSPVKRSEEITKNNYSHCQFTTTLTPGLSKK